MHQTGLPEVDVDVIFIVNEILDTFWEYINLKMVFNVAATADGYFKFMPWDTLGLFEGTLLEEVSRMLTKATLKVASQGVRIPSSALSTSMPQKFNTAFLKIDLKMFNEWVGQFSSETLIWLVWNEMWGNLAQLSHNQF